MKIGAKAIPLFKDLLQYDLEHNHYDFHNDYDCIGIENKELNLKIRLKEISTGIIVSLKFLNVEIVYSDISYEGISDTLDSLYRGRYEQNQQLIEFYEQRGFFYMEFYNGCRLEFWAESISLENASDVGASSMSLS